MSVALKAVSTVLLTADGLAVQWVASTAVYLEQWKVAVSAAMLALKPAAVKAELRDVQMVVDLAFAKAVNSVVMTAF